jgi:hypothetical protein
MKTPNSVSSEPGAGHAVILCLQHTSAVVDPASRSRNIPMICSSVNRLGFMSIPFPGDDGLYPFLDEASGSGQG